VNIGIIHVALEPRAAGFAAGHTLEPPLAKRRNPVDFVIFVLPGHSNTEL